MKITNEEYELRYKIDAVLEKYGVVADVDYEEISEAIMQVVKNLQQPAVSGSLPADSEAKTVLRELLEMYMFNVDSEGEPKATIIETVELWKRASKIVES
jgi:hypothetical protein